MFKKSTISLIAILTCCVLMCVGFSAWTIAAPSIISRGSSGNIYGDDIIVSDDYVKIESIQPFTYTNLGFELGDRNYSANGGVITVTFSIVDMELCRAFSVNGETIQVRISLKFDDGATSQLFAGNFISVASADGADVVEVYGYDKTTSQHTTVLTMDVSDSQTASSFTLKYTFNMGTDNDYKNFLYNLLYDTDRGFAFVVQLSNQ